MKIFFLKNALAYHNHKYTFSDFLKREKKVAKNKILLFKLYPDLIFYFKMPFLKKILFKILSLNALLFLYKMVNINMYYYFSWKKAQVN